MATQIIEPGQPSARLGPRSALAGLFLPFSLILPFAIMFGVAAVLSPAHGIQMDESIGAVVAVALLTTFLAAGGVLWGRALSRIAGVDRAGRMAIAGAVSHVAMTVLAAQVLGQLELEFVERGNTTLPIHVVFTVLFVPATFIVAAVMAGAVTLAGGHGQASARVGLSAGAAAALAFLVLNVIQDVLGRRVGGPNAAATATMLTVMFIGNIGAAMAMSAVIGRALAGRAR